MVLAGSASAQSNNLTLDLTVPFGGVSYSFFTVTSQGVFDIWTTSRLGTAGTTPFDPVMYLFSGTGTGGTRISSNDDGCGASAALLAQCGPSASFSNSILNDLFLNVGDYTVAVGDFGFSEAEARNGTNPGELGGDYSLRIASLEEFGGGRGEATSVPEPASVAMLVAGMFGFGAAARRRRSA